MSLITTHWPKLKLSSAKWTAECWLELDLSSSLRGNNFKSINQSINFTTQQTALWLSVYESSRQIFLKNLKRLRHYLDFKPNFVLDQQNKHRHNVRVLRSQFTITMLLTPVLILNLKKQRLEVFQHFWFKTSFGLFIILLILKLLNKQSFFGAW